MSEATLDQCALGNQQPDIQRDWKLIYVVSVVLHLSSRSLLNFDQVGAKKTRKAGLLDCHKFLFASKACRVRVCEALTTEDVPKSPAKQTLLPEVRTKVPNLLLWLVERDVVDAQAKNVHLAKDLGWRARDSSKATGFTPAKQQGNRYTIIRANSTDERRSESALG